MLDGLNRQDRDYAEHLKSSMADQQFRQWQSEPPELHLKNMVSGLLNADPKASIGRVAGIDTSVQKSTVLTNDQMLDAAVFPSSLTTKETLGPVMARWSPTTAAPSEPLGSLESRVTIVGPDHRGEGRYCHPRCYLDE